MMEPYIEYWGLKKHPFLLAPDSNMMYMAGQYFECLERLKYGVNTNKGGVLIVSEDAGLGKTTMLLKLIDELKQKQGDIFRFAFIDHPTLDASQLISFITWEISGLKPHEDKLKNILLLKETLIELKKQNGKAIIIVDEGQVLCGRYDIIQELRILINLNYNNEYLHTFIFSGQKPLWEEVKRLPEFWQRLPVKYYLMPLRLHETKELIKFRLNKAGLNTQSQIFTDEALEMIHRHSKGSPRTIIALSDMALLVGYTDRASIIGFKEIYKAINIMSGKGESLPYVANEKTIEKKSVLNAFKTVNKKTDNTENKKRMEIEAESKTKVRPFFIILAFIFFILLGGLIYHYFILSYETKTLKQKLEIIEHNNELKKAQSNEAEGQKIIERTPSINGSQKSEGIHNEKELIIVKPVVNIRAAPDISATKIGIIFAGEKIKIKDQKKDHNGDTWFKILLYGEREGWISEKVVMVK